MWFRAANNKVEYEELIAGLSLAKGMGIKKLDIQSDSQLVVNQLLGTYQARDSRMTAYLVPLRDSSLHLRSSTSFKFPDLRITILML